MKKIVGALMAALTFAVMIGGFAMADVPIDLTEDVAVVHVEIAPDEPLAFVEPAAVLAKEPVAGAVVETVGMVAPVVVGSHSVAALHVSQLTHARGEDEDSEDAVPIAA